MCQNLAAKSKANIIVFDSCDEIMQKASSMSDVTCANSIEEIGTGCSLVFTMLPGCEAVNSVMTKLMASTTTTGTVVDCSTVHPKTSRYWNGRLKVSDCEFVDAPVSGGVAGAKEGKLTFMVGASDTATFEAVTPYLECMGSRVAFCGGSGTGAVAKLCNNLALATQMIGICEAANLGEALGVDPKILADVMNDSTAACWSSRVNHPHPQVAAAHAPAANAYKGGFASRLMLKDLGLAIAAANDEKVATPLGSTAKQLYSMASEHGFGDQDFGVILQLLREKSTSKQ